MQEIMAEALILEPGNSQQGKYEGGRGAEGGPVYIEVFDAWTIFRGCVLMEHEAVIGRLV